MHRIVHDRKESNTTERHSLQPKDSNQPLLSFILFFFLDNLCFLMEYQTAQRGHLEKFPPLDFQDAKYLNELRTFQQHNFVCTRTRISEGDITEHQIGGWLPQ